MVPGVLARRRYLWLALSLGVLLAVALLGLHLASLPSRSSGSTISSVPPACAGESCALGPGVRGVQLFVEPEAGVTPITGAIAGATRSVWVEVYLLSDARVINALEEAAQRGIDVRVRPEAHPYGGDVVSPQRTLQTLTTAGIAARFANLAYTYTHAKLWLVDGATLYVLTANLSRSGLGGSSIARNRESGVIDTHGDDVAEAQAVFQADWNRTRPVLHDGNMIVSPENARAKILALLNLARRSLVIEDDEMFDLAAEDALIAAARRGVTVRLVLPGPSSIMAADAARLAACGVRLADLSAPYVHAKVILADGRLAFLLARRISRRPRLTRIERSVCCSPTRKRWQSLPRRSNVTGPLARQHQGFGKGGRHNGDGDCALSGAAGQRRRAGRWAGGRVEGYRERRGMPLGAPLPLCRG